jgi:hypothetical protein
MPSLPLVRGAFNGRAVLDRQTIQVLDLQAETDEYPEGSELARRLLHRTAAGPFDPRGHGHRVDFYATHRSAPVRRPTNQFIAHLCAARTCSPLPVLRKNVISQCLTYCPQFVAGLNVFSMPATTGSNTAFLATG